MPHADTTNAPPPAQTPDWFEAGLTFSCTQCGNCCTGPPGYVWFTDDEAHAMASELGLSVDAFRQRYAKRKHGKWTLGEVKRGGRYDCVFLRWTDDGRGLCGVYGSRPQQCRTWPFWPENLTDPRAWAAAAQTCPGMKRDDGTFVPAERVRVIRDSHE